MIESRPEWQNAGPDGAWEDSGTKITASTETACVAYFSVELLLYSKESEQNWGGNSYETTEMPDWVFSGLSQISISY